MFSILNIFKNARAAFEPLNSYLVTARQAACISRFRINPHWLEPPPVSARHMACRSGSRIKPHWLLPPPLVARQYACLSGSWINPHWLEALLVFEELVLSALARHAACISLSLINPHWLLPPPVSARHLACKSGSRMKPQ